jgi:acyl transferase domain-containing protein/thioesterase domain-containing protein/acyl carrier protein
MTAGESTAPAFAVIGMSGRFPGAAGPAQLWTNLRDGVESITFFSDDELLAAGESAERLRDPDYVKANGRLADIDKFDAAFFGMSPRDAAVFDPQHRVFLECAWEAFEDAGYVAEHFDGPVAVFAASGGAEYLMHNLLPNRNIMETVGAWLVRHTGNDPNFLATRASYELDLNGPSMSIQTACSSSLVAIHMACQSLANGECDMALAGGSTIYPEQNRGYIYKEGEILSPDGHCRAFDANSAGTVMSSAVGCVIVRRLDDAIQDGDRILAVIRGSAINNDGSDKVGYLAPSVTGQARVVSEALAIAGVHPEDVSYVEAHGTGTLIGDPIEVTALTQAFRAETDKKQFCAIGSLKSNIGHTGEASGICSFIKTVLALQNRQIPPSLHFDTPNPQADFPNSPFFVNTQLRDWTVAPGKTRIAGVTSLGAGGTNCHVIVEEAPAVSTGPRARTHELLVLSAKSATALDQTTQRFAAHLRAHPDANLADEAFTLLSGRKGFAHRRALVAATVEDAIVALEAPDAKRLMTQRATLDSAPSINFMFPGGGAQYARMGADLYEHEPVYRDAFDEALSHLEPALIAEIRNLVFADAEDVVAASACLESPSRGLPALLATEYAIAKLLASWGIEPAAMIGHSAGEYAAACLAGTITVREAMQLIAVRGRLFETLDAGGMLSVPLPADEARQYLGMDLSIAAINAPELCVLSGPIEAVDAAEAALRERQVDSTRVHINVAAHSMMVEPILVEFERFCRTIDFKPPQIPFVSNVTGTWITDAEATDPKYWVRHLRQTVRFADGAQALIESGQSVFCEIGPGRTLASLIRMQPGKIVAATPTLRHPREAESDVAFLLGAVGRLWISGVPLDEYQFFDGQDRRRTALPTYPFEHQRYWVDPDPVATPEPRQPAIQKSADIGEWFYASSWARSAPPSPTLTGPTEWLVFTDRGSLAQAITARLRDEGHTVVEVEIAARFTRLGSTRFGLNPSLRADFDALTEALREQGLLPRRVLHLWALERPAARGLFKRGWNPLDQYDAGLTRDYFSLVFFAQAFAADCDDLRLFCVSSQLQAAPGDTEVHPEKAALLGPCKVIPREYPQISAVSIDLASTHDIRHSIDRLLAELRGDATDDEVALRGRDRWVRRIDSISLAPTPARPWLRANGVYVITGGLGGIGLRVAEHLAQAAHVKLVLISRTALPDDEQHDSWLAAHSPHDVTSRRIRAVRKIRALGSEVLTLAADVADAAAMRRAMAVIQARFGHVHGVFHAAGVLEDELIALRKPEARSNVLDVKMKGALVLDAVLRDQPLDLFVVFSSVSSILGLPGQVDYTAANAFLDAFAQGRSMRGPGRTLSIDWNAWQSVGMLAERSAAPAHPALECVLSDDTAATLFRTTFRRGQSWLLSEHVVRGGNALIPGTGFLEIARAAVAHHPDPRPVEVRDVVFLAPFAVGANDERALYVRVERHGEREFTCYAESEKDPLVVGKIGYMDASPAAVADLEAIRARCTTSGPAQDGRLVQHFMDFGPRWSNVKRIDLGHGEALLSLELPAAFVADLDTYRLHPALMDMATGAAQVIVPGFDPRATFHVPFSYDRILIRGGLPQRVFSHVRLRDARARDSVVFDVSVYDENGAELVRIDGFTMRKAASSFAVSVPRSTASEVSRARVETATEAAIREGMTPEEGVEALDRVLAVDFAPQVVVCTVPLHAWLDQLSAEARGVTDTNGSSAATASTPVRGDASNGVAPRNSIERELAALWSSLLGVADVGVHDDFFDLGGHSLIAVRLLGKIKKAFGVDFALEALFRAPTIATCAQLIAEELGVELAVPAASEPLDSQQLAQVVVSDEPPLPVQRPRAGWSPLVPIQLKGSRPPVFCVHGAGGNVLNLRDLSRRLGDDQPFYGLQAQGVDGKLPPLRSVDEMASLYLPAIRAVQSHGPYFLAGYSGGGVVALEMAQRLLADGEEVRFLGFLDTYCPVLPRRDGLLELVARRMSLEERFALAIDLVVRGSRWRPKWWPGFEFGLNRARIAIQTRGGRPIPHELREFALYDAFLTAHEAYRPKAYHGLITLWRAQEENPRLTWLGNDLGWAPFVAGGLEVQVIPGNHQSLVLEPNVDKLVAGLREALDRAMNALVMEAA